MKIILYPLAFIVGAYCLVLALLYINQYKLLYFPAPKISSIKLPELSFRSGDLTLSGYLLDLSQSSGVKDVPAIIYYGGNAEAIEENAPFFAEFLKGFKIYLVPYRGYGGNPGLPREKELYQDALNIFDEVAKENTKIILMGRSLGSSIATYVAAHRDINKLVLITPFDSAENIAQDIYPYIPAKLLFKDKYRSWERAPKIEAPTILLIAVQDEVISTRSSEALIKSFTEVTPQVVKIEGADHNSISQYKEYVQVLESFLRE